ncbi:MAG: alpha/beta hydrolase [Anaerolineae bacterium]|nr:alpha/beta hydrolase [Anaerolineae bacterium]
MEHFRHVNNIVLHYLDHKGNEPTILLLPGLTANANEFDGLIKAGLSPRFRVLALDLRGRGQTEKPATGYSMADHAADVLGLLELLGIQQVIMGGHSFGALLTLYIAAHHPERIRKMIIIDGAAKLHPRVRELIQPSLNRMGRVFASWDEYIKIIKQNPAFHGWWDPTIESYYRADVQTNADGTVQSRLYKEGILEATDKALEEPYSEYVSRIDKPAILLNALGAYGPEGTPPVLPHEQAQETVQAIKNCRYVEIPGNHITMLFGDSAKIVVDTITQFVEED